MLKYAIKTVYMLKCEPKLHNKVLSPQLRSNESVFKRKAKVRSFYVKLFTLTIPCSYHSPDLDRPVLFLCPIPLIWCFTLDPLRSGIWHQMQVGGCSSHLSNEIYFTGGTGKSSPMRLDKHEVWGLVTAPDGGHLLYFRRVFPSFLLYNFRQKTSICNDNI